MAFEDVKVEIEEHLLEDMKKEPYQEVKLCLVDSYLLVERVPLNYSSDDLLEYFIFAEQLYYFDYPPIWLQNLGEEAYYFEDLIVMISLCLKSLEEICFWEDLLVNSLVDFT